VSSEKLREHSPKQAHERLDDYYVIDVRFDHEVDGPLGSIEGSERIDRADLAHRVDDLKGESLLVVCRSGRRSAAACEALKELGHGDVTNLEGGMIAWNEAGLPVARKRPHHLRDLVDSIVRWFGMMTQKPHAEARAHLGVKDGDDHAHEDVHRALEVAAEHLEGESSPPDLKRSIDVFHEDLAQLKESSGREA
jgi:rhodanese-related sulfurtransferase